MQDDDSLAVFQTTLLELLDEQPTTDEILRRLKTDVAFRPFQAYVAASRGWWKSPPSWSRSGRFAAALADQCLVALKKWGKHPAYLGLHRNERKPRLLQQVSREGQVITVDTAGQFELTFSRSRGREN